MKKLISISVCAVLLASCSTSPKADLFITNATIIEGSGTRSNTSIVVNDGRIIALGNRDSLANLYTFEKVIDLSGKFLYPGFIDAHTHFLGYGLNKQNVDLIGTSSWREIVDRCVQFQQENQVDFLIGRGWDQNDWEFKAFPNKALLDSAFGEIPVLLTRIDGHAAIVNSAALEKFNIQPDTQVEGGKIVVENGECTGVLLDHAIDLIQIPEASVALKTKALLEAQQDCFAEGLTTIDEAGLPRRDLELIDSLQKTGLLKIRIYGMVSDSKEDLEYYMKAGPYKTDLLSIRSFKVYGDGALGSRGACLLKPYHDQPNESGFLLHDPEHFQSVAQTLAIHGWQMNTHAIGDSANRLMLQIYLDALGENDTSRWRIEHAQVIDAHDFKDFGRAGIIPSVQPTHATSDAPWAEDRLGSDRIKDAYNYRKLLAYAHHLALGTDFPVEPISPINTFRAAVFRSLDTNSNDLGFLPEGAIFRSEALNGMTIWAAYSNFEETEKGKIDVGFFGDFTILDTDLLHASQADVAKAKVMMTIVNGEVVYSTLK